MQIESASLFNSWGNVGSTVFYAITYILFVDVIFSNINQFAGYSRNDVLMLMILTQSNFFIMHMWSSPNINTLIENVRNGRFDLILAKPIPSIFYSSIREIRLMSFYVMEFHHLLRLR